MWWWVLMVLCGVIYVPAWIAGESGDWIVFAGAGFLFMLLAVNHEIDTYVRRRHRS